MKNIFVCHREGCLLRYIFINETVISVFIKAGSSTALQFVNGSIRVSSLFPHPYLIRLSVWFYQEDSALCCLKEELQLVPGKALNEPYIAIRGTRKWNEKYCNKIAEFAVLPYHLYFHSMLSVINLTIIRCWTSALIVTDSPQCCNFLCISKIKITGYVIIYV